MSDKYFGTVIWFNSKLNYGFIEWEKDGEKQKDLFVHFSDIECEGYKTLYKDQKVQFEIGENRHGAPKATLVKVMK